MPRRTSGALLNCTSHHSMTSILRLMSRQLRKLPSSRVAPPHVQFPHLRPVVDTDRNVAGGQNAETYLYQRNKLAAELD